MSCESALEHEGALAESDPDGARQTLVEPSTEEDPDAIDAPGFSPIGDAYCVWGVARMVTEYMDENAGRWPRSWDDLEPYLMDNRMVGWTLKAHADRVWIDFDADVDELYRAANADDLELGVIPFDVIRAKSMFALQWGEGPNGVLLRHLQRDRGEPAHR